MSSRIALVTGGTRGLGRAVAVALAEAGHTPVLLYRSDKEAASAAVEAIRPHAPDVACYRGDVANAEQLATIVDEIERKHGRIQILVNNAFRSGRPPQKTHELDPAAWREDLDVNLTGQFLATRACLPHMIAAGYGRIVFIGSLAQRGEPGRVAYATVKAALTGFAKTIAVSYTHLTLPTICSV